jgi:hypothetical protein
MLIRHMQGYISQPASFIQDFLLQILYSQPATFFENFWPKILY